jgi:hypothetical protein
MSNTQAVFRRLAKRIGGEAHTPELDNDSEPERTAALVVILRWCSLRVSPFAALAAFFNALQTDAFTAQNHHLTSDDLAMACECSPRPCAQTAHVDLASTFSHRYLCFDFPRREPLYGSAAAASPPVITFFPRSVSLRFTWLLYDPSMSTI